MKTACNRCGRRLSGFVSQHMGVGPVCLRKGHREAAEAEEKAAREAQPDLFESEIKVAGVSKRMRELVERINALTDRAERKRRDVAAVPQEPAPGASAGA